MTALAVVHPIGSRKLSPAEARDLANLAAVHVGTRGVARELLLMLLRHPGGRMQRGYGWFVRELACDRTTAIRAMNRLRAAGIVSLEGEGGPQKGRNTYVVNVAAIRALADGDTPGESPVHPGDSSGETPLVAPSATSGETPPPLEAKRHHLGGETPPPNARAGTSNQIDHQRGPTPASRTSPASVVSSPAASDRGPSMDHPQRGKCPHGRTAAQGGCRICGTNSRAQLARDEQAEAEQRRAARRRAEEKRLEDMRAEAAETVPINFDWRAAMKAKPTSSEETHE